MQLLILQNASFRGKVGTLQLGLAAAGDRTCCSARVGMVLLWLH